MTDDEWETELRLRFKAVRHATRAADRWVEFGTMGAALDPLGLPVFLFTGDADRHRDDIAARLPTGTDFETRSVDRTRRRTVGCSSAS